MSAELKILAEDGEPIELVALGEVEAEEGQPGVGEQRPFVLANTGTTHLADIAISVEGPGADFIALAVDDDGEPGVWAEPGRPISLVQDVLRPGEQARFWAQVRFGSEDEEEIHYFELRVSAASIVQSTAGAP